MTTLAAGSHLGPYEILSPLGAGGMGEVYRARDPRLSREVAIKVLSSSVSQDADRLRRFEQEARAAGALNHPNITAVYDVGQHDGAPYVVSELLEGRTLRDRIAESSIPPRKAVEYALQIAGGLAAAHDKGIVHRDLKPENLFVTKDGIVKILDFGLAKRSARTDARSDAPTGTEPGVLLGTVAYMSPEQVRGEPLDHRSDLFSLASILYEMVSGRRAFAGDSAVETMMAVLREEPPEVPNVSLELDRLIRHGLEKDRGDRFQSARDLAFSLREIAASEPVSAGGSGPSTGSDSGGRPGPSIAVLPFRNMSAGPENDYFSDGITEEIISALSRIETLRVAARTSSFAFRGKDEDVRKIGRQLGVRTVLEGSVRQAGQKLRITAQLIGVADGYHLWSDRYDCGMEDVFAVQDEIARSISETLKVRLLGSAEEPLVTPGTRDPEAYDLYLKGRYFVNQRILSEAVPPFEQAIARDPGFAAAYTGVADAIAIRGFYGGIDTREAFARSRAAAEKARALEPDSADVHVSLGIIEHYYGWDFAKEEEHFRRAIQRSPRAATPHAWLALVVGLLGRRLEEALKIGRRGAELEPLSANARTCIGWPYLMAGRYDDALRELRHAVHIDPRAIYALWSLGTLHQIRGEYGDAISLYEQVVALDGAQSHSLALLGSGCAAAGRVEDARRCLAQLKERAEREYVAPLFFAYILAPLGEIEEALAAVRTACEHRNALAWWHVPHNPILAPVRSHPDFPAVLEKIVPA